MPPKKDLNCETDIGEMINKMVDSFKRSSNKIMEQMNLNFKKHVEILTCEIFEMKKRMDQVIDENKKLKQDNAELRKDQMATKTRRDTLEANLDNAEQLKLKDNVVITGKFELPESATVTNLVSFIHKTANVVISPAAVSNIASFKNKQGLSVVKASISNIKESSSVDMQKSPG